MPTPTEDLDREFWNEAVQTMPRDQLRAEQFVDPVFGYAWTLQRLNHLAERYRRRSIDSSLPPMT